MLPQGGSWSNLKGSVAYPDPPTVRPELPAKLISFALLGPIILNDIDRQLNERWWVVTQEYSKVMIRGAI